ncbi:MAG: signal recognition particle receptor subunit alpha [Candidatus Babeliales bacterium]
MFDFLTQKFSDAFSYLTGQRTLTEKNVAQVIQKLKQALLEADVPYHTVNDFIAAVQAEVLGTQVLKSLKADEHFAKIVHAKLVDFLGRESSFSPHLNRVVLVAGLQGSGKTTTVAKLVHYFAHQHENKVRAFVGSVDFYRPAAIEQLAQMAHRVGATFFEPAGTNVLDEVKRFVSQARAGNYNLVILDTAGRLHVDQTMLAELQQVHAIVQPTDTLLVLDAMTGQESLAVARAFNEAIGFDGVILTKMDSNSRAGAAFAFRYELKKDIWFVGTGEKVEDLELFKGDRLASRLIGMGDLETLIERAEQKIKKEETQSWQGAMASGTMTLRDFAAQLRTMNKLGSIGQLMRYMPGVSAQKVSQETLAQSEREIKRFLAIADSMTAKELSQYRIINGERKKRIAAGAGVAASEVTQFIARFEQMLQFVKLLGTMGGAQKFFK